MDILVINLMRLGDLVQSGPVLRGLKARHPQARLTLVAMDIFRETAALLRPVDRLMTFPSLELASAMDREGWPEACRRLACWLKEHLKPRPDLTVNLTPTLLAGLLARASAAPAILGLTVSHERELATFPAWASYSLVVSKARAANPFNVVDLFVRGAGMAPDGQGLVLELAPECRAAAQHWRAGLSLPAGTRLIGLMPGASRPERQWPPEEFAQAARLMLREQPCHFLLLGGPGERALGEAIRSRLPAGAATLKTGETGVRELAGWLAALDLLITNDTGPMHLAAAVGTRVLALFLASARVRDTGPAGAGHAALEPRTACHPCRHPCPRPHCHDQIMPAAVASLALEMVNQGALAIREEAPEWEKVQILATLIDPGGHQSALPLIRRPLSREDFWLWVHRLAWERLLAGDPADPFLTDWLGAVLREHYSPPKDGLGIAESQAALRELAALARQGEKRAGEIHGLAARASRPPVTSVRMRRQLAALEVIDQGLRRLAAGFPELAALVEFFFQDQRVRPGREIAPLAHDLGRCYGALRRAGELCQEAAAWLASHWLPGAFDAEATAAVAQAVHITAASRSWQHPQAR